MSEQEYYDEESSLLRPALPSSSSSRRDDPAAKRPLCSPTLTVTVTAFVLLFLGVAISTTIGNSSGLSLFFDDGQEQQHLLTTKMMTPAMMSVPKEYRVEIVGRSKKKMKHKKIEPKKETKKEKSQPRASEVDFTKIDWSQVDYSKVDWSDPNYWAKYVDELDKKEKKNK